MNSDQYRVLVLYIHFLRFGLYLVPTNFLELKLIRDILSGNIFTVTFQIPELLLTIQTGLIHPGSWQTGIEASNTICVKWSNS